MSEFTITVPTEAFATAVAKEIEARAWSVISPLLRDPAGNLTKRLQQVAAQAIEDVLQDVTFIARLRQVARETVERALAERVASAIKRMKPDQITLFATVSTAETDHG